MHSFCHTHTQLMLSYFTNKSNGFHVHHIQSFPNMHRYKRIPLYSCCLLCFSGTSFTTNLNVLVLGDYLKLYLTSWMVVLWWNCKYTVFCLNGKKCPYRTVGNFRGGLNFVYFRGPSKSTKIKTLLIFGLTLRTCNCAYVTTNIKTHGN